MKVEWILHIRGLKTRSQNYPHLLSKQKSIYRLDINETNRFQAETFNSIVDEKTAEFSVWAGPIVGSMWEHQIDIE